MKKLITLLFIPMACCILILSACNKDEPGTFEAVIKSGGTTDPAENSQDIVDPNEILPTKLYKRNAS